MFQLHVLIQNDYSETINTPLSNATFAAQFFLQPQTKTINDSIEIATINDSE